MTPEGDAKPLRSDAARNRARILDAAEQVFTQSGASGSTEEIARRAGVAVGTVFRHFPTKDALLHAITKHRVDRLVEQLDRLDHGPERGTALFTFFTRMVEQAAMKKRVVDLLDQAGVEISLPDAVQQLERSVGRLLHHAQHAGTVDEAVRLRDVMALLTSLCQGALVAGWDRDLQERILTIVFAGLRPHHPPERPAQRPSSVAPA